MWMHGQQTPMAEQQKAAHNLLTTAPLAMLIMQLPLLDSLTWARERGTGGHRLSALGHSVREKGPDSSKHSSTCLALEAQTQSP